MRSIAITTKDFAGPVLGKATRNGVPKTARRDYVFIADHNNLDDCKGYLAILTLQGSEDARLRRKRAPTAYAARRLDEINDGDIVLLEPEKGSLTVLYATKSRHNAMLITERCNCSCVMCPQPPRRDERPLTATNRRLIQLMAPGPEVLALTGGEPTLVWNDLLSLVTECATKLPETRLALLTNGRVFRNVRLVEQLVSVGHRNLLLAVPLYSDIDSIHDTIVGAEGAFGDTVRGLHNLAAYRVPVELRTVLLRENYQRLPQFVEFIYRNLPFVDHTAIMGLEPTGLAEANLNRVWVDPYDAKEQLLAACTYLHRRLIPNALYNLQLCVVPSELWAVARRSISDWKNVYLPECEGCDVKHQCGGFFRSGIDHHSAHIAPIKRP